MKEVEIDIHKDHFGRMFELPFQGTSYTYEAPQEYNNFKGTIAFNLLVVNCMEKRKFSFQTFLLKPKVHVIHYLQTIILLPNNFNLNYVIRDDVVPLSLLIEKFPTNRIEGIFLHMITFKENMSAGLSFGAIITNALGKIQHRYHVRSIRVIQQ